MKSYEVEEEEVVNVVEEEEEGVETLETQACPGPGVRPQKRGHKMSGEQFASGARLLGVSMSRLSLSRLWVNSGVKVIPGYLLYQGFNLVTVSCFGVKARHEVFLYQG